MVPIDLETHEIISHMTSKWSYSFETALLTVQHNNKTAEGNVAQTKCSMLTLCIVGITVNYGIKHISRVHTGNLSSVVSGYMINTEGY